jgi:hypothetical protein
VSAQAESQQTVESATSAVVEPPHDAKDTATIAANINTNFFIFLLLFEIKKYLLFKTECKITNFF